MRYLSPRAKQVVGILVGGLGIFLLSGCQQSDSTGVDKPLMTNAPPPPPRPAGKPVLSPGIAAGGNGTVPANPVVNKNKAE